MPKSGPNSGSMLCLTCEVQNPLRNTNHSKLHGSMVPGYTNLPKRCEPHTPKTTPKHIINLNSFAQRTRHILNTLCLPFNFDVFKVIFLIGTLILHPYGSIFKSGNFGLLEPCSVVVISNIGFFRTVLN